MNGKCAAWCILAATTAGSAEAQFHYSVSVGGGPRYYVVEPMPAVARPMWGRHYVGRRGFYYYRPAPVYVAQPIVVAPAQPAATPIQSVEPKNSAPVVEIGRAHV